MIPPPSQRISIRRLVLMLLLLVLMLLVLMLLVLMLLLLVLMLFKSSQLPNILHSLGVTSYVKAPEKGGGGVSSITGAPRGFVLLLPPGPRFSERGGVHALELMMEGGDYRLLLLLPTLPSVPWESD
ncbi:unnamed protein product [Pleuronectes platessa]|uniref:Uncharacterized protein n=1 Tax=Pleuronectes platessa TaxID=8262 RepID=A0A9N7URJ1_PLEPL|nr:unnamed protein product [Pleuronectes platessa]